MNPSDCGDTDQALRNSGVSAFNHSENAVRASHESNQAGDEGETQDYNQEEDIESSTHGSYQEKPPAFWEVHKKKLIYGGFIAVAFTALVGILAVVLGDGGENKKVSETPSVSLESLSFWFCFELICPKLILFILPYLTCLLLSYSIENSRNTNAFLVAFFAHMQPFV